jgi:hypothetical protein
LNGSRALEEDFVPTDEGEVIDVVDKEMQSEPTERSQTSTSGVSRTTDPDLETRGMETEAPSLAGGKMRECMAATSSTLGMGVP